MPTERVLLQAEGFGVDYDSTPILADIALSVHAGEVVALIGASGSGKSALLRALLGLSPATAQTRGSLRFAQADGGLRERRDITPLRGATIGFVPQDPQTALSAHRTVAQHLDEVLATHAPGSTRPMRAEQAAALLTSVGLTGELLARYPHALSGGQGQRVLVALALAGNPAILLADEPTSALDPRATHELLALLQAQARVQRRGVLIVSHDLSATAHAADRVAVLAGGRLVEIGATAAVLSQPQHPLTAALMAACPPLTPPRPARLAEAPRPAPCARVARACAFAATCGRAQSVCAETPPAWRTIAGREVACHWPLGAA